MKISQSDLAGIIRSSEKYISKIETGRVKCSDNVLCDISYALKCSIEYLREGSEVTLPEYQQICNEMKLLSRDDLRHVGKYVDFCLEKKGSLKTE